MKLQIRKGVLGSMPAFSEAELSDEQVHSACQTSTIGRCYIARMPSPLLDRLNLALPILQAPLGGGISSPELAAAVSAMLHDARGRGARSFNLVPLFTPESLRPQQPEGAVEYVALYAGESAKRIHAIDGAFDVTRQLGEAALDASLARASLQEFTTLRFRALSEHGAWEARTDIVPKAAR